MKIIRLEANNIKRLKAVTIQPDGSVVIVGGKNGQGKSSTLDAIAYALAGKQAICERPLRDGTSKGQVLVDLGELVVRRTFTASGGTALVVTAKDGEVLKSPQLIMDKLLGVHGLTFDPLEFVRMPGREQIDTLRTLVGLDFSTLDAERTKLYNERTIVGREVDKAKGAFLSAPHHPDAPPTETPIAAWMAKLSAAQEHNQANTTKRQAADRLRFGLPEAEGYITRVEKEIARLELELSAKKKDLAVLQQRHADLVKEVEAADDLCSQLKDIDESVIRQHVADADKINTTVRANAHRAQLQEQFAKSEKQYEALSARITAIDNEKQTALSKAKFPLPGLSFDDSGVILNNVPFAQASSAEQLRAAVAIGLETNPQLRVVLIRDGSLLDADNLKMIADLSEKHDAQIWIERVSEGDECSVIIEDGQVMIEDEPVEAQ